MALNKRVIQPASPLQFERVHARQDGFVPAELGFGQLIVRAGGAKKDPNALTEEENRQLDNAAEMLDASPDGHSAKTDTRLRPRRISAFDPLRTSGAGVS
jgi:hypothetical protein